MTTNGCRELSCPQHGPANRLATDTIRSVARPRGVLSEETLRELALSKKNLEHREAVYRRTVLAALSEGSFSAVAEATGLSKDTLQRWKREAN